MDFETGIVTFEAERIVFLFTFKDLSLKCWYYDISLPDTSIVQFGIERTVVFHFDNGIDLFGLEMTVFFATSAGN